MRFSELPEIKNNLQHSLFREGEGAKLDLRTSRGVC